MSKTKVNKFTFNDKYKYNVGDNFNLTYGDTVYNCKVVSCIPKDDLDLYEVTIHLPDNTYLEMNDEIFSFSI